MAVNSTITYTATESLIDPGRNGLEFTINAEIVAFNPVFDEEIISTRTKSKLNKMVVVWGSIKGANVETAPIAPASYYNWIEFLDSVKDGSNFTMTNPHTNTVVEYTLEDSYTETVVNSGQRNHFKFSFKVMPA